MITWEDINHVLSGLIAKAETNKNIDYYKNRKSNFKSDLKILIEMGGIISGGGALGMLYGIKIKDIDIYFNDKKTFEEAYLLGLAQPRIDPCFYIEKPYELHDLTATMLTMNGNGKFEISNEAQNTYDTNICHINKHNLINHKKTAERILKYNKKYGFKFKLEEIIPIFALSNVKFDKNIILHHDQ